MILAAIRRALDEKRRSDHAHGRHVAAMLYLGGLAWFLIALSVKHSADRLHGFTRHDA